MDKVSHGDQQDKSAHNVTTKVIITRSFNTIFYQCTMWQSQWCNQSLCVPYLNAQTLFISCQTISPYQECNISPVLQITHGELHSTLPIPSRNV